MKKIIKFLICALLVSLGITLGVLFKDYFASTGYSIKHKNSNDVDKIAVVNTDSGIDKKNGEYVNYSKDIIKYNKTFIYVDNEENAMDGLKHGEFAAVIVIPDNFSKSIESINGNIEKSKLDYYLNNKLTNNAQRKALENIFKYQNNIQRKVINEYSATLVQEVHSGQNNANKVVNNMLGNVATINDVNTDKLQTDIPITTKSNEDSTKSSKLDNGKIKTKNTGDNIQNIIDGQNNIEHKVNDIDLTSLSASFENLQKHVDEDILNFNLIDNKKTTLEELVELTNDEIYQIYNNNYNLITENGTKKLYALSDEEVEYINDMFLNNNNSDNSNIGSDGYNSSKKILSEKNQVGFDKITNNENIDKYLVSGLSLENKGDKKYIDDQLKNNEKLNKSAEQVKIKINNDELSENDLNGFKELLKQTNEKTNNKVSEIKNEIANNNNQINSEVENAKALQDSLKNEITSLTDILGNQNTKFLDEISNINKNIDKSNKENKIKLENGLKIAKNSIANNDNSSRKLLTSFIGQIPNSKINGQLNEEYIQKMGSPFDIENNQLYEDDNIKIVMDENKELLKFIIFFDLVLIAIILGYFISKKRKKKVEYEEI